MQVSRVILALRVLMLYMEIRDLWIILVLELAHSVAAVVSNTLAEFSGVLLVRDFNLDLICWCLEVTAG